MRHRRPTKTAERPVSPWDRPGSFTAAPKQYHTVRRKRALHYGISAPSMSASLIGRLGQALSGYPPVQCRCRSRARASLRTRHQGPSIIGVEDEVGQSNGRPCRQCNGRFKPTYELHLILRPARDIIPPLGGFSVRARAGCMSGAGQNARTAGRPVAPAAAISSRTSRRTKMPCSRSPPLKHLVPQQ